MSRPPRDRHGRLFQGESPTEPMPMADMLRHTPYRHARIPGEAAEDAAVRRGVDLAARVGELMLRSGAGAPEVEGSVAAVAAAAGVDVLELDITLQSLLLQATSSEGRQHTLLRVVRRSRLDYGRLVAVHQLVAALVAGQVSADQAAAKLREIKRHRRNYSLLGLAIANALLASAVAVMIGAGAFAALVTVVVVLAVSGVRQLYAQIGLPEFYGNAINAFTATMLAGGFYALSTAGLVPMPTQDFAFIVAGGIVAMLPGRTMASAIEDVLFGYPLTGAGRLLSVALALMGLIIGIVTGLTVMVTVSELTDGAFVPPSALNLNPGQASVPAAIGGALVVGLAGAVTVQSRRRVVLPVGLLSVAAATVSTLATRGVGVGPIMASAAAAVALGVAGRLVAQRLNTPSMVLVVPASFALLPGLAIFRGLYELVVTGSDAGLLSLQSGLTTLLGAGAVLLAIATGTVLGDVLASPWDRRYRGSASGSDISSSS